MMGMLLGVALLLAGLPGGEPVLSLPDGGIVQSRMVRISVSAPGQEVFLRVIYRPNSQTRVVEDPVLVPEGGVVSWTPRYPGIASLSVTDASGAVLAQKDVAIRFAGIPASGIAVMTLAGLLLFGGAMASLVLALRRAPDEA